MFKHSVNFLAGFMVSLLCFTASAPAAPLQLSQVPLYLGGNIGPNVMFTLDDSGSMMFEIMPGDFIVPSGSCSGEVVYVFPRANNVYGPSDYTNCTVRFNATNRYARYFRTSDYNQIYYNLAIRYVPWTNADGTLMPNADPVAAPHNPMNTGAGTRNLAPTSNPKTTVRWLNDTGSVSSSEQSYYPATYFKYKGPTPLNGPTDANNIQSNFDLIEIKAANAPFPKAADRTDCTGATCTYTEEIQNFANWYTYYRSRVLTARAGVGRAFVAQSNDPTSPSILRVGFGAINVGSATIDGQSSPGTVVKGVRKFTGTDRTNFFNSLYTHAIPAQGTPLRNALDDVGKYFERNDPQGPWTETPGTSSTVPQRACRQSYNILMTDGYWNDTAAPTPAARANVDNSNGPPITNDSLNPTPATYQYSPVNPYKDAWGDPNPNGGTLADVAMYYWNRDLHPTLLNKVLPNAADPAFWQHMVTHTVGLGVFGTLDSATDLPALTDGTKTWPQPSSGAGAVNLDDLWHTALNSRGEFFSAADPDTFADSLSSILSTIVDRNSSAASVALNSGSITSDSHLYQAKFNTSNWSGQLLSIKIQTNGKIPLDAKGKPIPDWDAAKLLDAPVTDVRKIVTYKPSAAGAGSPGIPFRWPADPAAPTSTELDPAQITALNTNPATGLPDVPTPRGSERLDYLRGEAVSGFRTRTSRLGDSVYSSPAFVGAPQARYHNWRPGDPETGTYSGFESSKAGRAPMVYVGANDGMLHGFDATGGPPLPAAQSCSPTCPRACSRTSTSSPIRPTTIASMSMAARSWAMPSSAEPGTRCWLGGCAAEARAFMPSISPIHRTPPPIWRTISPPRCCGSSPTLMTRSRPPRSKVMSISAIPTAIPTSCACTTASGRQCSVAAITTPIPSMTPRLAPRATPCSISSTSPMGA